EKQIYLKKRQKSFKLFCIFCWCFLTILTIPSLFSLDFSRTETYGPIIFLILINSTFIILYLNILKLGQLLIYNKGIIYPPNTYISFIRKKKHLIPFSIIKKISIQEYISKTLDEKREYKIIYFEIFTKFKKKPYTFYEPIYNFQKLKKIFQHFSSKNNVIFEINDN
ncbi:MAG: hypothetical protein KAJ51_01100, partial [Thermoplasmata archaeon]|nr:hypothetical protein [Thermoplasmata archaeon]